MSKKLIISFIAASILVFSVITPALADDFLASSRAVNLKTAIERANLV